MRRRKQQHPRPFDLLENDSARWTPMAKDDESGGSLAYYRALRRAGVRGVVAHMMRAAAHVQDLKTARDARLAAGTPF